MTLMLNRIGRPAIAFEAEGAGTAAAVVEPAAAAAVASPESILFPKEGEESKPDLAAGDDKTGKEGEGENKAADWKEYANDPAKSEAENAAAKAEHDKTKPADDKSKDDPANKVPEDGKYALTMPEGVEVDQALLDAVGPEFKELGLTNAQAQKLADRFIKVEQDRGADRMKRWGETVSGWVDTAKADKDMGGDKWKGTVSDAQRAVNTIGTPDLKNYLEATGGGNHPELIRFMAKVGAMIKEDNPADGGAGGASKPADPAHILFKNDVPKG
jgi:hypothetical protein